MKGIVIFLILFLGISAGLNYSGFCISESRYLYLSDDEKIKRVFEYQNSRYALVVNGRVYRVIPYKSFAIFKERNPDCCTINGFGDTPSPKYYDRLWGRSADTVIMHYTVNYIDESGISKFQLVKSFKILNNCGKIQL